MAVELGNRVHDINAQPGAMYVVGPEPTKLLRVNEYSDTLEMYPDLDLMRETMDQESIHHFELEPTLRNQASVTFERDAVVLGVAHILRRACMGRLTLSDIEASSLANLLSRRLLYRQLGVEALPSRLSNSELSRKMIGQVGEFIEENLTRRITLDSLANLAQLSPFHFARCFKSTTGLAPHQYVLARRIELAKRLIMTTSMTVQDIAWSIGYENISHFRRQFAAQIGALPGNLRTTRSSSARRKFLGR